MSTNWFSGIQAASSGLNAARYGLGVVGQNMTNSATVGYTRQTVEQSEVDSSSISGIYTGKGTLDGVSVTATNRSTDAALDARTRSEHALSSLADTRASQLTSVESVFGEPSDSGLSAQLSTFWKDWGTVATATSNNSSSTTAARNVLLKDAGTAVSTLNSMSTSLGQLVSSTQQSLSGDVDAVNTAATQLATLNGAIAIGNATGASVNSLLDQRDQLLDTLSKASGAKVTLEPNGQATVALGGQTLVSGTVASQVTVDSSAGISVNGTAVTVPAGSMSAEITALTTTLPSYQSALDNVADTLSSTVNTVVTTGYDQHGNPGTAMFQGTGAAGITVAISDPAAVAASGTPGGTLDTSVANKLSQTALQNGSPDGVYTTLIGTVAAASAAATQSSTAQSSVTSYVDQLKTSMSGVSLDDEAANMLIYQQAFNASSRVLTAIDSMLDTLINHTGLVGSA